MQQQPYAIMQQAPPSPMTYPPSVTHSLPSVTSDASVDPNQPILLCVDRNAHKQWFDEQIPCLRRVKVKRYKTVETFMHFLEKYAKRRIVKLRLFMLVRISDVEKLIEEVNKKVPNAAKAFRGIYVYERCFASTSTKSIKQVPESIRALENVSFHDSLENACKRAHEAMGHDLNPEQGVSLNF